MAIGTFSKRDNESLVSLMSNFLRKDDVVIKPKMRLHGSSRFGHRKKEKGPIKIIESPSMGRRLATQHVIIQKKRDKKIPGIPTFIGALETTCSWG